MPLSLAYKPIRGTQQKIQNETRRRLKFFFGTYRRIQSSCGFEKVKMICSLLLLVVFTTPPYIPSRVWWQIKHMFSGFSSLFGIGAQRRKREKNEVYSPPGRAILSCHGYKEPKIAHRQFYGLVVMRRSHMSLLIDFSLQFTVHYISMPLFDIIERAFNNRMRNRKNKHTFILAASPRVAVMSS